MAHIPIPTLNNPASIRSVFQIPQKTKMMLYYFDARNMDSWSATERLSKTVEHLSEALDRDDYFIHGVMTMGETRIELYDLENIEKSVEDYDLSEEALQQIRDIVLMEKVK
jgi:hypothetical protein